MMAGDTCHFDAWGKELNSCHSHSSLQSWEASHTKYDRALCLKDLKPWHLLIINDFPHRASHHGPSLHWDPLELAGENFNRDLLSWSLQIHLLLRDQSPRGHFRTLWFYSKPRGVKRFDIFILTNCSSPRSTSNVNDTENSWRGLFPVTSSICSPGSLGTSRDIC